MQRSDESLRAHLVRLLDGRGAHLALLDELTTFPAELQRARVPNAPYTAWQLLEHMRIAQWDILEFSRDPKHVSPPFPEGYWPEEEPADADAWRDSVERFRGDLRAMQELIQDPQNDLFTNIPHGDGQTLLREALILADHNSYHLGQLVLIHRMLQQI